MSTAHRPGWLSGSSKGRYRAEHRHAEHDRTRTWRAIWTTTAEGTGLALEVKVPAGITAVAPPLLGVVDHHGQPLVLVVEMLRGQTPEDYRKVTDRLAYAFDASVVVIIEHGGRTLGMELHDTDPLARPFPLAPVALTRAAESLILGRAEDGTVLAHSLCEACHLLVTGQNGSGKSVWCYGTIGQVAHAADVIVAGCDITGLLLGRPFQHTRHRAWQATGTADLEAHAVLLEALVAEMDRRLADMPLGVDKLTPTPEVPLFLVVMEEWPGLLRAAGSLPKPGKGERSVLDRIKSANLRLLSEGRKAAFRVLTLAQRAEAEAVGGGYARDQYALAISFRVPSESLVMAHGEEARELGARHRFAEPGIAIVSAPGRPLARMRAPYVGEYPEYCRRVRVAPASTAPAGTITTALGGAA